MGTTDFQSEDDTDGFDSTSVNSNVLQNLIANKTLVALSTAAMLTLAGASASQIASYSGTQYNGAPGACAKSFDIVAHNDPELTTTIGGQQVASASAENDLNNFSTVYNTSAGETKLQTVNGSGGEGHMFSTEVKLTSGNWSIDLQPSNDSPDGGFDENVYATITAPDGSTSYVSNGDSMTEPDGTVITSSGDNFTITQPLNGGGQLTTSVVGRVYENTMFMDEEQSASGAAVVSGSSIAMATGDDTAVLALPCSAIDPNNPGASQPSPAAAPAPPPAAATPQPAPPTPTPIPPALDTSTGEAGDEAM